MVLKLNGLKQIGEKNNTAVEAWTQDRFICQNSSTAPCVFLMADFSSDIKRSPNYEQDWVQIVCIVVVLFFQNQLMFKFQCGFCALFKMSGRW